MNGLRYLMLLISLAWLGAAHGQGTYTATNWGVLTFHLTGEGVQVRPQADERTGQPDFVAQITRVARKGPVLQSLGVLQFQATAPLAIEAALQTPQGLLTQWWPNASTVAPRLNNRAVASLKDGNLVWSNLELKPNEPLEYRSLPPESLLASLRPTSGHGFMINGQAEALIYYRALYDLPAGLVAQPGTTVGTIQVRNVSDRAVPQVMVVAVRGERSWWHLIPSLAAGATMDLPTPTQVAPPAAMATAASARWAEILRQAGLPEPSASALLKLHHEAWFTREGLRLLYLLPKGECEKLMPLKLTPEPTTLTRAMVAVVEAPAPWQLDEVRELVAQLGAASFQARQTAEQKLRAMGNQVEGTLREQLKLTDDPEIQFRLRDLLLAMGAMTESKPAAEGAVPMNDFGRMKQLMIQGGGRRAPAQIIVEDVQDMQQGDE